MKKVLLAALAAALIAGSAGVAQAKKVEDLNVDISGLAQIGYVGAQSGAGINNGFDINRLRIKLAAQPAEKIAFKGAIEAAGQGFGANQTGLFPTPEGRVVDAYVTLSYLDWAKIMIGQMPTPVSYELNTDEYALETINYSQFVGAYANRDRGVGVAIPVTDAVDLTFWGLNGEGAIDGASDSIDDSAAYGAMINVKPVKDLGIKAFVNTTDFTASGATLNALPGLAGTFTAANKSELSADVFGLGAEYKIYGWHFFGEYAQAKFKAKDTTGQLGSMKSKDYYVNASYKIPETGVQLVARYDRYDPDTTTASDEKKITTVGVNWDFEKDARVQLMQELKSESPSIKDNKTMVQLSVRF